MILCTFCEDRASARYELYQGLVVYGPSLIRFCRNHLLRFYLGLETQGAFE